MKGRQVRHLIITVDTANGFVDMQTYAVQSANGRTLGAGKNFSTTSLDPAVRPNGRTLAAKNTRYLASGRPTLPL